MIHLRKHLTSLLRAATHPTTIALSSSLHCRAVLLSTSASPASFSIDDYLVATCGLTRAQSLKAAKQLPNIRSASKPDAVLALLCGVGLSRRDIAAVVASDPLLLRARVGTVGPRLASLRERVGLSNPEIARFLQAGGARALRSVDVVPKVEFWIPFFGSFDKLLQAMRGNTRLLQSDLEKVAKPNIALLEQCGLSVSGIKLVTRSTWLLAFKPERVKELLLRAEKLGGPRSSCSFKHALRIVSSLSDDKISAKMEFLRSTLGCSMDKISVVVCKMPLILGLSEENLRRKIEFLVTEAGLGLEHIVERSVLLSYSLEKRLVPRHYVVKILQAKGLMKECAAFHPLVYCGCGNFMEKYIDCHKDAVPGLADAYAALCAGKMPTKVTLTALDRILDIRSIFQAYTLRNMSCHELIS